MSFSAYKPKCQDSRRCFAKKDDGTCSALSSTDFNGKPCPFRKLSIAVLPAKSKHESEGEE